MILIPNSDHQSMNRSEKSNLNSYPPKYNSSKQQYKDRDLFASSSFYSSSNVPRNVTFSSSTPSGINNQNFDNNYNNSNIFSGSSNSRLLMPVISTLTTTTTTTVANVANDDVLLLEVSNLSVNSPPASGGGSSIVDESKLLLREYEQLRSDSVSEIQRAHDSLNAR